MARNLSKQNTADEKARLHEEALEKISDLESRINELEKSAAHLKDREKMNSMFIASMSHELRTPLSTIIGFTGIMLQGMAGKVNPEQKDMLSRCYDASKHLLELVSNLIDVTKVEAGRMDVFPEEFALHALVHDAVDAIKSEADTKGLSLKADVPTQCFLSTDRKLLLRCLNNLLTNAVKFTETGSIEVTALQQNGSIEIAVKDTGIGITKEALPALFDSFVRPDGPRAKTAQGSGIGLYLTRKLATDILNGNVKAESTSGKGSIFTLTIPQILKLK